MSTKIKTVGELIAELQKYDDKTIINSTGEVDLGIEVVDGVNIIFEFGEIVLTPSETTNSYYVPGEYSDEDEYPENYGIEWCDNIAKNKQE